MRWMKSKPLHIFALHDFFLSTSPPFQFYSKDAFTKCLTSGGEDELDFGLAAGRVNPERASKEHPKNTRSLEVKRNLTHQLERVVTSETQVGGWRSCYRRECSANNFRMILLFNLATVGSWSIVYTVSKSLEVELKF
jgi:hypothetical protein